MTSFRKKLLIILIVALAATSCKTTEKRTTYKVDYQYYPAEGEEKDVAIIVLGGGEGGIPSFNSWLYTSEGYPVMLLGYFGTENTPKNNWDTIPLEYFDDAIKVFKSKDMVKNKKIVVIGTSKGGSLALLLGSLNPDINGVIGRVPGSVVWGGFWGMNISEWSLNGEPLPYVTPLPLEIINPSTEEEFKLFKENIIKSLEQDIEDATIKVENINGPILLFSGIEDIVAPSTDICNNMIKRLDEKGFGFEYEHIAYEDAGHSLNTDYIWGGSWVGNQEAGVDSIERTFKFLEKLNEK